MKLLFKKISLLLSFVLMLSACSSPRPATHKSLVNQPLPTLFSLDDLGKSEKDTYNYRISPDGKKLAWIGKIYNGRGYYPTAFYKEIGSDKVHHLKGYMWGFEWMPDSRHLYVVGADHSEVTTLYLRDITIPYREPYVLFQEPETQVLVEDVLKDDPEHMLIIHNERDKTVYDLYRLNIKTKKTTLLHENDGEITGIILDRSAKNGKVFAFIKNEKIIVAVDSDEILYELTGNETIKHVEYDHKKDTLRLFANKDRDTLAVVDFDLKTKTEKVIVEDKNVDIELYHYDKNYDPMFAITYPNYQEVKALDLRYQPLIDTFKTASDVRININSYDDNQEWFVIQKTTTQGMQRYLYNLNTQRTELLEETSSLAFKGELAKMKPIQYQSTDGLTINAYLTLPVGIQAKNLPTVLLVHGGPMARDYWDFNETAQFLANRGYAVLQVNYRGSTGYGKAFFEAGFGEFAGKMHSDLIDGVNWVTNEGIADPDKIAIMGASYGGYATLVGMTMTPEYFACGVDIFGMSDLELMSENFPPHWKLYLPLWQQYIGNYDNEEDRQKMREQSPINYVEQITNPILVIQGTKDIRVVAEHSTRFVRAAKAVGKDIEYWEMSGIGHNFGPKETTEKLYRKVDNFLAQCLGGRTAD
jgi:dipeptidyl aminopeptidase/acylaminoacyl peptidase